MNIKANKLILNRSNELVYSSGNCWAPLGAFAVNRLAVALDALAADEVDVCFNTTERYADQDTKTYTKRMRSLPGWYTFTGFKNQVINGHTLAVVFCGKLYRTIPK